MTRGVRRGGPSAGGRFDLSGAAAPCRSESCLREMSRILKIKHLLLDMAAFTTQFHTHPSTKRLRRRNNKVSPDSRDVY